MTPLLSVRHLSKTFVLPRNSRDIVTRAPRQRLQALRDSPHAFSASYEEEAGRSVDEVAARIAPAADGTVCVSACSRTTRWPGWWR